MSVTLANAAAVHEHHASGSGRGITLTTHHIGHLAPGDLFRPDPRGSTRTVTEIHRRRNRVSLTDQTGTEFTYPAESILPTAVADPLVPVRPPAKRGVAACETSSCG